MPFEPFVPPPPQSGRWVPTHPTPMPPPPPGYVQQPAHIQVSQLPVTPKRKRKPWWFWLIVVLALLLFEPVRIFGFVLLLFWIVAIGMMPHVAVIKTMARGGD